MQKNNPKVALFTSSWPPCSNGVTSYVFHLFQGMEEMNIPCFVLSSNVQEKPSGNDRVIKLKKRKFEDHLSCMARTLNKLVRRHKIDIFEMEESFGSASSIQNKVSIPLVIKLHGPWFLNGPANRVKESADYFKRVEAEGEAIKKADGITAPSLDVLRKTELFYNLNFPNCRVIPNPVSLSVQIEKWNLDSCDKNNILFVGRFDSHKGADILIKAFGHIAEKVPNCSLTIVGPDYGLIEDGRIYHLHEYLNKTVQSEKIRNKIQYLGPQPFELLSALRKKAFLNIVSSRYENFPNTVLESLSLGCPTVASAVGGIPEIIKDGFNGLLFGGENYKDLADQVVRLMNDPSLAERLGKQAAEDVSNRFNAKKIAQETLDFYAQTINLWKIKRKEINQQRPLKKLVSFFKRYLHRSKLSKNKS